MQFYTKLFIFFFMIAITNAFSQTNSCEALDMRSTLPPVRDQNKLGSCFAFSAADLISQQIGVEISAIDIASSYLFGNVNKLKKSKNRKIQKYFKENPKFLEQLDDDQTIVDENNHNTNILRELLSLSGDEGEAITVANLGGLCLESNLPSTFSSQEKLINMSQDQFQLIKNQIGKISELAARYSRLNAVANKTEAALTHLYKNNLNRVCGKRIPLKGPFIPETYQLADTLSDLREKELTGEIDIESSEAFMIEKLNTILNSGRAVAIGYSGQMLTKEMSVQEMEKLNSGDHSSLIVGRKKINDECNYLIRNSWGKSCEFYKGSLRSQCEEGNVWVSESELKKTLYSIISIRFMTSSK